MLRRLQQADYSLQTWAGRSLYSVKRALQSFIIATMGHYSGHYPSSKSQVSPFW